MAWQVCSPGIKQGLPGCGSGLEHFGSSQWSRSCALTVFVVDVPRLHGHCASMAFPCRLPKIHVGPHSQETASVAQRLRRQRAESGAILLCMKDSMKLKTAKAGKAAAFRLKSILVPLDFSPPSKQALSYAVSVAQQFKAKVTLLN